MSDSGDHARQACARWDIPQIDDVLTAGTPGATAHDGRQKGYEKGFAQGRQEALEAGRAAVQAEVERLQQLMQTLSEPFTALDEEVETALLTLAMQVAEQVVHRELATQPELVLKVIHEAVAVLPVSSRQVELRLHPDDARLVEEHMGAQLEEGAWRMNGDTAVTRGGCIVTTGHSRIDATVEQQIARIAENVLGAAGEEPGEP